MYRTFIEQKYMLDSIGHKSSPEAYGSRAGEERQAYFYLRN